MRYCISERVRVWNEDRKLLDNLDHFKEASFLLEECSELLRANTDEQRIDSLNDLKVFILGYEMKMGYDPDACMDECLKHIESDSGFFDEEQGKWIKTSRTYKPQYELCKI